MDYTGYKTIVLTEEEIADLFSPDKVVDKIDNEHFNENEYAVVVDEKGNSIAKYRYHDGMMLPVKYSVFSSEHNGLLKPRNTQQELAFDMLMDPTSTIKLITGGFGSGKTLLLCNAAIAAIEKHKFDKIVWIRNNVQVKDTDALGALPGDEMDKLLPYVMPLADHTGGIDGVRALLAEGKLEIIPLAFLRGRSIRNSIIISSEAENLTKEHIQLIMGRVDEGSNLWMDADCHQRDRNIFTKSQGIETMIERLAGEPLFGYVHLCKTERSETARLADKLD